MEKNKPNNRLQHLYHFLWVAPFFCFLFGYSIFSFFIPQPTLVTPSLLGKSSTQALCILSEYNLHAQVLTEKEDTTLPTGTIISQTPHPFTTIKPQQTVYLVLSKKPTLHITPAYIDTPLEVCKKQAQSQNIKLRIYALPHTRIQDACLAQIPLPETPLENDIVTIYTAQNADHMVIMPDLKNKTVDAIKTYFASFPITTTIHHTKTTHASSHDCSQCKVKEQKPLPGSLISLQKPLRVQLII